MGTGLVPPGQWATELCIRSGSDDQEMRHPTRMAATAEGDLETRTGLRDGWGTFRRKAPQYHHVSPAPDHKSLSPQVQRNWLGRSGRTTMVVVCVWGTLLGRGCGVWGEGLAALHGRTSDAQKRAESLECLCTCQCDSGGLGSSGDPPTRATRAAVSTVLEHTSTTWSALTQDSTRTDRKLQPSAPTASVHSVEQTFFSSA